MGNLPSVIQQQITKNLFPRLLLIYSSITINPNNKPVVSESFDLMNLDFRDKLTGLNLVYDIRIEKTIVTTTKRGNLYVNSYDSNYTLYTVQDVRINTIEGNSVDNRQTILRYKIVGKVGDIKVKYTVFQDILGDVGGYWGIFGAVGQIVSFLYRGYFFRADMLNSVFEFREDEAFFEEDDVEFKRLQTIKTEKDQKEEKIKIMEQTIQEHQKLELVKMTAAYKLENEKKSNNDI